MTTYRVVHTIQSTDTSNPPVEVPYYTGPDLAEAISAMAQAATSRDSRWTTNLSVRLDFVPDLTWDFETDAGLDDCIYWSRPEADCAGPRVGVRTDGVTMCEYHVNNVPS